MPQQFYYWGKPLFNRDLASTAGNGIHNLAELFEHLHQLFIAVVRPRPNGIPRQSNDHLDDALLHLHLHRHRKTQTPSRRGRGRRNAKCSSASATSDDSDDSAESRMVMKLDTQTEVLT